MPASQSEAYALKGEKEFVAGDIGEVEVTAADLAGPDDPTEDELTTLRRIAAPMPWVAIAMCGVELAERASYYGCKEPFGNFIRGKLPAGGNGAGAVAPGAIGAQQSAGALGLGSVTASALTTLFSFLAYVIPIYGGIVADTKWGRFKTICVGTAVGGLAHILLVIPAIPSVIAVPKGSLAAFIISLLILAGAAGFIKPSLGPLLCDQIPVRKLTIQTTKKGERVIIDPQVTVERWLLIFYWCINVGAFFAVATSYSARFVGFWLAFLLPGILYFAMPILLVLMYKRLYKAPPQGSVLVETIRVFKYLLKDGGWGRIRKGGDEFWDRAKPSYMAARDGTVDESVVFWDDRFVDEIRQSFAACVVFMVVSCLAPSHVAFLTTLDSRLRTLFRWYR
jgi:POT family proton-dependent oligopeptide transporter